MPTEVPERALLLLAVLVWSAVAALLVLLVRELVHGLRPRGRGGAASGSRR